VVITFNYIIYYSSTKCNINHVGFGNNTHAACAYCRDHANDECCQQVTYCKQSLSAGAIVGIVIGSLVGAALIIFAAIWYYCRKRRHTPMNPFTQFLSSANTSTTVASHHNQQQRQQQQGQLQNTAPTTAATTLNGTVGGGVPFNACKLNDIDSPFMNDKMEIVDNYSSNTIPNPLNTTTDPTKILSTNNTPLNEEFFVVVHAYPPQMPDELELNAGDIVCLALYFDDGWALGYNVTTGLKGAFPLVCISPAPEESLNQLLQMELLPTTMIDSNNNITSNTSSLQITMDKIRENARRSLSLNSYNNYNNSIHSSNSFNNHNINQSTIPKRSASYKSYDYFEIDSPSSPTLHTPLFDVNVTPTHFEQNNNTSNADSQRQPAP
jgi:hypothetical protein